MTYGTSSIAAALWDGIAEVAGIKLNGQEQGGYPGILNVSVDDIEGESLLLALEPLCVATGSACNSQSRNRLMYCGRLAVATRGAKLRFASAWDVRRAAMRSMWR